MFAYKVKIPVKYVVKNLISSLKMLHSVDFDFHRVSRFLVMKTI